MAKALSHYVNPERQDKWTLVRLGDVAYIQPGFPFSSQFFVEAGTPGATPLIRIRDVVRGRTDTAYNGPLDTDVLQTYQVSEGDILIGMDGEFNTVRWPYSGALLNQRVARLLELGETVDSDFLYFAIGRPLKVIEAAKHFTTVKHLSMGDLRGLEIPLPPIEEQRARGRVLRAVEQTRDATEKVIAATRELKRSLMRHLFTYGPVPVAAAEDVELQATEIGPVPRHWSIKPLGELIARGPQNGIYKPAGAYGSGVMVVRINDFSEEGEVLVSAPKRMSVSAGEVLKYGVSPGDIIFNRVNSLPQLGKTALVGKLEEPLVFESNMMRFTVNDDLVMPEFVFRWLCYPLVRKLIRGRAKRAVAQSSINQAT